MVEAGGGWSVVSGMSTTGWEVGVLVSTESPVTPVVVDNVDDVTASSPSMLFESLFRLILPLARNLVGILMIFDCWCLALLLCSPCRAERMSALPILLSETWPSPGLYW